MLEAYLARNGVRAERVARDPARANLIARVAAAAPARRSRWRATPTSSTPIPRTGARRRSRGELRDGHLWGRGALDMKGQTAASAVALAVLARSGWVPNGDVLLIAEADEEDGVDEVGMSWLVRERPDLRCDYALTESNYRLALADGRTIYTLVVGEKMTMPVRVIARGVAGHASVPTLGDNALPKLAPVLERLAAYEPVRRSSPELDGPAGRGRAGRRVARGADRARPRPAPELWHLLPALAGSTIVPTMTGASRKRNVIPAEAWVEYDCRVLPGTEPEELLGEFRAALDGLDVELELAEPPLGGTRSPFEIAPARRARRVGRELEPGALLVPD